MSKEGEPSTEKTEETKAPAEENECGTENNVKKRIKVTVVGDSGVGKTCLLMTFANNKFPEEAVNRQSLFENSKGNEGTIKAGCEGSFEVPVTMETEYGPVELGLTDTIGTDNYRPFREVFGAKTEMFLVCFSVTEPETLENVKTNWTAEIKSLAPKAPFILVGTKTDLREDDEVMGKLKEEGKQAVTLLKGIKIAKSLGAMEYVECSSRNMVSVKSVFGTVLLMMAEKEGKKIRRRKKSGQNTCSVS